ncbi:MAG: 30S ribosomal protein S8 [Bacteroidales bacterium]|jgi:small subunit ribosomal protein S8|nr:30S ribosomal protein S8 [Bacteroidales bacterium]
MNTDPISDFLTRIRNAIMANHKMVEIPSSKTKREITKILFEKGFILNYKFEDATHPATIKIALKYHPATKQSAVNKLERVSRPGLRKYVNAGELPTVLNGLGIAIISTSHGMMTDKEAKTQNVGGEVLCYIS